MADCVFSMTGLTDPRPAIFEGEPFEDRRRETGGVPSTFAVLTENLSLKFMTAAADLWMDLVIWWRVDWHWTL